MAMFLWWLFSSTCLDMHMETVLNPAPQQHIHTYIVRSKVGGVVRLTVVELQESCEQARRRRSGDGHGLQHDAAVLGQHQTQPHRLSRVLCTHDDNHNHIIYLLRG